MTPCSLSVNLSGVTISGLPKKKAYRFAVFPEAKLKTSYRSFIGFIVKLQRGMALLSIAKTITTRFVGLLSILHSIPNVFLFQSILLILKKNRLPRLLRFFLRAELSICTALLQMNTATLCLHICCNGRQSKMRKSTVVHPMIFTGFRQPMIRTILCTACIGSKRDSAELLFIGWEHLIFQYEASAIASTRVPNSYGHFGLKTSKRSFAFTAENRSAWRKYAGTCYNSG